MARARDRRDGKAAATGRGLVVGVYPFPFPCAPRKLKLCGKYTSAQSNHCDPWRVLVQVAPTYRRQGLARTLMGTLEETTEKMCV